jgi:hypothetical protein
MPSACQRSGCCPTRLATLAGMLPGTAAVVILGDALTGHVSPLLILVSLCIGVVGLALLAYEIRHHRQHRTAPATEVDVASEPALRG